MTIETTLCGWDFTVIAVYFAITLASGLFMGRFVKSSKDFFSGGKKVPWWMGAVSSYMAMISSFVFIAHAGVAYQDGLVAILVFWSTVFAIVVGSWIFAWRWQRAKVTTPMEYLERRYGVGVRQVISWCGIAFRVLDNMVRLWQDIVGEEVSVPFYYTRTTLPTLGSSIRYNFTTNAQNFVSENRMYARSYIYDYKINKGNNRAVTLYLSGEALSDQEKLDLVELAGKYGIKANELKIKENAIDSDDQSKKLVEGIYERMDRQLEAKENEILALQATVDSLNGKRIPYEQITAETIAQYPSVTGLHLSRGATVEADSTRVDGILAIVYCDDELSPENKVRLENWLRVRLGDADLTLMTIKAE